MIQEELRKKQEELRKKEAKIRLEIVELIHKIYMAEYRDLQKLDILSKIQLEVLSKLE